MNELLSEENVAVVLKAAAVGRRCQLSRTISIILCLIQKCFLRTSKTTSKKWLLEFPDCCANSSTSTVDQVLINGSRSSDFKGWFLCQPPIFIKNQPTNKKNNRKKRLCFLSPRHRNKVVEPTTRPTMVACSSQNTSVKSALPADKYLQPWTQHHNKIQNKLFRSKSKSCTHQHDNSMKQKGLSFTKNLRVEQVLGFQCML